jgi:hypothetical protein
MAISAITVFPADVFAATTAFASPQRPLMKNSLCGGLK